MKFLVETSARHVHLTQEHLEILFGKGYELTRKKDLSQPGQYACEERVTIVGSKKELAGVSILGPVRKATQGLANYIIKQNGQAKGVAIAFDSRRMSLNLPMKLRFVWQPTALKHIFLMHFVRHRNFHLR